MSQRLQHLAWLRSEGFYADYSFRKETMQPLLCVTVVKCVLGCSSAALFWSGTVTAAEQCGWHKVIEPVKTKELFTRAPFMAPYILPLAYEINALPSQPPNFPRGEVAKSVSGSLGHRTLNCGIKIFHPPPPPHIESQLSSRPCHFWRHTHT